MGTGQNLGRLVLEARIADLHIAERELEALDAGPILRTKLKAKAKRKSATHNESEHDRPLAPLSPTF